MVGNHCADVAASAALNAIPSEMKKLADSIAAHVTSEEHDFHAFLKYLAVFNKARMQEVTELKKTNRYSIYKPADSKSCAATRHWPI